MRKALAEERDQMLKERQETVAKKQAEVKLINDTWDSLADMGLAEQKRHEEMLKQKEVCYMKLLKCFRRLCDGVFFCLALTVSFFQFSSLFYVGTFVVPSSLSCHVIQGRSQRFFYSEDLTFCSHLNNYIMRCNARWFFVLLKN